VSTLCQIGTSVGNRDYDNSWDDDKRCSSLLPISGEALLERLSDFEQNRSVESLHLSPYAIRALVAKNIHTIGTLFDGVFAGLVVLGNVGRKTFSESEDALSALSRSVGSNGCVDWLQYASKRNFAILPRDDYAKLSPRQFLQVFPSVAKAAVHRVMARPKLLCSKNT
jgi:hypothetical protein